MACPHPEVLAAMAEQLLDPREREAVLDHAADCDDCRRVLLTLESERPAVARPRATVRVRPAPSSGFPWAVAAALAVSVVGLLLFAGRVPVPKPEAPEARRDPVPVEPPRVEEPAPRRPKPTPVAPLPPTPEPTRPEEPRTVPNQPPPPKPPEPPPVPEKPAPPVDEKPAPPPSKPATVTIVAVLDGVEGGVTVVNGKNRTPAKAGQSLQTGDGVECDGVRSRALVTFADRTRLELGAETTVREMIERDGTRGRRIVLSKGTVKAEVSKQPTGLAMIFETPHGEAKVLGTTLALTVDTDPKKGTRLEVEEGKVELKNGAGRTTLVEGGHQAIAATGVALAVKTLSKEEVLFAYTFEDGKKPPSASSGVLERGPGGRICLAGDPDPGGSSRVFLGDVERGLFTYQGDEVLSFDYWVDAQAGSVNFNFWNSTQKRTHDGEVAKLVMGKWAHATFRLADLGEPGTRPKEGDWIANLHLQGTGSPPRRFYVDNIVITRARILKPRVFETNK